MAMFVQSDSYSYEQLIQCAEGALFGPGNPQLPAPPMLMFDRIAHINDHGGTFGKGEVVAELDIRPDLWFFDCHFYGDPVMPGCLGLDAMWQLVGFYLGWIGGKGRGRALGAGEVRYSGEIKPDAGTAIYRVNIKRVIQRQLWMGIADATLHVGGEVIYSANGLRVGLFTESEKGKERG